jgi:hypothetical protein
VSFDNIPKSILKCQPKGEGSLKRTQKQWKDSVCNIQVSVGVFSSGGGEAD